jgi:hypothetical protein
MDGWIRFDAIISQTYTTMRLNGTGWLSYPVAFPNYSLLDWIERLENLAAFNSPVGIYRTRGHVYYALTARGQTADCTDVVRLISYVVST